MGAERRAFCQDTQGHLWQIGTEMAIKVITNTWSGQAKGCHKLLARFDSGLPRLDKLQIFQIRKRWKCLHIRGPAIFNVLFCLQMMTWTPFMKKLTCVFGQLRMECKIKVMFVHQIHHFGKWHVVEEIYFIWSVISPVKHRGRSLGVFLGTHL